MNEEQILWTKPQEHRFTTKKNKTVRNQITTRKISQATPTINKKGRKIKKETESNKEQINYQKPKKKHKRVRGKLKKKQRNLNIGEHNTNENNHYHDHVS
jgi:hypothetical protein